MGLCLNPPGKARRCLFVFILFLGLGVPKACWGPSIPQFLVQACSDDNSLTTKRCGIYRQSCYCLVHFRLSFCERTQTQVQTLDCLAPFDPDRDRLDYVSIKQHLHSAFVLPVSLATSIHVDIDNDPLAQFDISQKSSQLDRQHHEHLQSQALQVVFNKHTFSCRMVSLPCLKAATSRMSLILQTEYPAIRGDSCAQCCPIIPLTHESA